MIGMNPICKESSTFDISVIQGDDFTMIYQFIDSSGDILDNSSIANVYISCVNLNYQNTLLWNAQYQGWELDISSQDTTNFIQCVTTYDLTVYFSDTTIQTEVYNAKFTVLLKKNRVVLNG